MIRTTSVSVIQLMTWVPDPIFAPSPSLNSGSSRPTTPPWLARTMPVRRFTTRIPASRAGAAAASQSLTTSARKPEPAGADSSTSRPPVSP